MEKNKYLKISLETLSKVFSPEGAKMTIDVMAKLKLEGSAEVSAALMGQCNLVLYERVKMLKGDVKAGEFLKQLKTACG